MCDEELLYDVGRLTFRSDVTVSWDESLNGTSYPPFVVDE